MIEKCRTYQLEMCGWHDIGWEVEEYEDGFVDIRYGSIDASGIMTPNAGRSMLMRSICYIFKPYVPPTYPEIFGDA